MNHDSDPYFDQLCAERFGMINVIPFEPKPMPFSRLLDALSGIVTDQTVSVVLIAYEPNGVSVRTFGGKADCSSAIDAARSAMSQDETS